MATSPALRFAPGRSLRVDKPVAELYEDAIRRGEGMVAAEGPLVVRTGQHTGRSPQDKFIVEEPTTRDHIWWGPVNRPISEAHYDRLRTRLVAYLADRDLYVQHASIGARSCPPPLAPRLSPRRPGRASSRGTSSARRSPSTRPATRTSRSSASRRSRRTRPPRGPAPRPRSSLHLQRMEIIIVGTEYAGEIKKSAFTVMNYLMPDEGVLPMHSAINVGQAGDPVDLLRPVGDRQDDALGRSAAQPHRRRRARLGPTASFNFEGGCYAKTIRLSPMYEPDIFQTTRRFGTVLENVDLDPRTRELDLDSERFTENTRGAYPLRLHRQRRPDRDRRPAAERRLPDRRRVRGPAAHLAAHPRAGRLPLHQWLHRQAGRHGSRGQGAEGDLLGLLRRPVHAAPPGASTRRCSPSASSATTCPSGWSTPAGPAARTGPASGWTSPIPARWSGPRIDGRPRRRADADRSRPSGWRSRWSCPDVPASFLDPRATWADPAAYDRQAAHAGGDVRRELRRVRRRRGAGGRWPPAPASTPAAVEAGDGAAKDASVAG